MEHVELFVHHDAVALSESVEVEHAVASAFIASASQLGMTCDVNWFWGATLYHPDDLLSGVFTGKHDHYIIIKTIQRQAHVNAWHSNSSLCKQDYCLLACIVVKADVTVWGCNNATNKMFR